MKLHVDKAADALYLRLDDSKIIESEEVAPGVIVDFDAKDRPVGVEVLHLSRRAPKTKAPRQFPLPVASAALVREKPARKYCA